MSIVLQTTVYNFYKGLEPSMVHSSGEMSNTSLLCLVVSHQRIFNDTDAAASRHHAKRVYGVVAKLALHDIAALKHL